MQKINKQTESRQMEKKSEKLQTSDAETEAKKMHRQQFSAFA